MTRSSHFAFLFADCHRYGLHVLRTAVWRAKQSSCEPAGIAPDHHDVSAQLNVRTGDLLRSVFTMVGFLRVLSSLLAFFALFSPANAEGTAPEPLIIPVADVPPFISLDVNGKPTGFWVDLAELLGNRIDVPIEYFEVDGSSGLIDAQASGMTQLLPGVFKLSAISPTNLFSQPILRESLQATVLTETYSELTETGLVGKRIGIVPPAIGSDEPILTVNTPVSFANPQSAFLALLSKEVDALLIPTPVAFGMAERAGLDGRIAFLSETVRQDARVVAVHESRAELLPSIEEALSELMSDGAIDQLLRKHHLVPPAPQPDVLTVGVADIPPVMNVSSDGSVSGFYVEVFEELAAQIGLNYSFLPMPLDEYRDSLRTGRADINAALIVSPERLEDFAFTYSISEVEYVAITAKSGRAVGDDLTDMSSWRVGTVLGSPVARWLANQSVETAHYFEDEQQLLSSLSALDLDVAVLTARVASRSLDASGLSEQLTIRSEAPLYRVDTAIALRPGLGAVRERFDAVIPGYLRSDSYQNLTAQYFAEPIFWTRTKMLYALVFLCVALAIVVFIVFVQRNVAKQREQSRQIDLLKQEERRARELEAALEELEKKHALEAENSRLKAFAYGLSHDLKSPAQNSGFLLSEVADCLSQAEPDVADLGALCHQLKLNNGRMLRLINDVLGYARAVESAASSKPIDLFELTEDVLQDLAQQISAKNAQVHVGALPRYKGDPIQLKSLIKNLIDNSLKYAQPDIQPSVSISGRETSGRIILTFSDNGIGIPSEQQTVVFEAFKRLHREADIDGTGLGLAICKQIARNHGGDIRVLETPENIGTTFEITLAVPGVERIKDAA